MNTTETVLVLVDSNTPAPSCNFGQGPDVPPLLDMADAYELCSGKIFPTTGEAEDCVLAASKVVDASGGCRPIEKVVESSQQQDNNCQYEVTVRYLP